MDTLYWATGRVEDSTLQRVAITQANGNPGPAALQPQHRSQIRRASASSLLDADYDITNMRLLATHPAVSEAGDNWTPEALWLLQTPPEERLDLPLYITTWLSNLASAEANVTVPAWN